MGAALSPLAEVLISKRLPRLGGLPGLPARITTAALTGLTCAAFALRFGITSFLPAFLFLAVLGVQLARIDAALHLLPNPLVLMLLAGGGLLLLFPGFLSSPTQDFARALLGAVILFAGYLILGLISPGAIGMGDVKLAAPIGLYLGYLGWAPLLYGGLLGFILNGLVTIILVALKGRNKTTEVAHGPSMLAAAAATALLLA
ncbi:MULTISPECIES: prepilin peptidase [unclassified Arthrobacter]|uniref:prepilin peptidase n=1 Tax=unclassified Arthrobacter TaxID=235627 RepID=UPI0027E298B6|nr:prepilin peptidase [Arthrobacter sp. MAHUQ-56]